MNDFTRPKGHHRGEFPGFEAWDSLGPYPVGGPKFFGLALGWVWGTQKLGFNDE